MSQSSSGALRTASTVASDWFKEYFYTHPNHRHSDPVLKNYANWMDNPSSYKVIKYCIFCWNSDLQKQQEKDEALVAQSVLPAPRDMSVIETFRAFYRP